MQISHSRPNCTQTLRLLSRYYGLTAVPRESRVADIVVCECDMIHDLLIVDNEVMVLPSEPRLVYS